MPLRGASRYPPHVNTEMLYLLTFLTPLLGTTDRRLISGARRCVCALLASPRAPCRATGAQDHTTQPKLLTMDILVLATMKNAAKCDTQCELQNSVNHQNFERILRSEVFLRACLSQWHLPLSPCGLLRASLRAAGLRAVRGLSFCGKDPLSLQEQSWPARRHISNCLCPA